MILGGFRIELLILLRRGSPALGVGSNQPPFILRDIKFLVSAITAYFSIVCVLFHHQRIIGKVCQNRLSRI